MSEEAFTYSTFISHASADREKAEEICSSLESRGLRCWIAPRDIRAGHEYADEIIHGIVNSRSLVLVLSEAANQSKFVRREVERAVSKGKPVFPFRIEEVLPSPSLEFFVSSTHWIDAWTGQLVNHVNRLARDMADESVMQQAADTSRKIARRRQMPRWIAMGCMFLALVVAIALGNQISSWFHRPAPTPGSDFVPEIDLASVQQKDIKPRIGFLITEGHNSQLSFDYPDQLKYHLEHAQIHYRFGDKPWKVCMWGSFIPFNYSSTDLEDLEATKSITVKFELRLEYSHRTGSIGPFTYKIDYDREVREAYKRRALEKQQWIEFDRSGRWTFRFLDNIYPAVKNVRLGTSENKLDIARPVEQPVSLISLNRPANLAARRYVNDQVLPQSLWGAETLFVQLEFFNGTLSDVRKFKRDPHIAPEFSRQATDGMTVPARDQQSDKVETAPFRDVSQPDSENGLLEQNKRAALQSDHWFMCGADGFASFGRLRNFFPAVKRIHFGENRDKLDRVIEIKQPGSAPDPRAMQSVADNYWLEYIPYRVGTDVYVQLEFYDGTRSDTRTAYRDTQAADVRQRFGGKSIGIVGGRDIGIGVPPTGASDGNKSPLLFAAVLGTSRNVYKVQFTPDPPPGTDEVLYRFDEGGFLKAKRLGDQNRRPCRGFQFTGPFKEISIGLKFSQKDGGEIGPFQYKLADPSLLLAKLLRNEFNSDLPSKVVCYRLNLDRPTSDSQHPAESPSGTPSFAEQMTEVDRANSLRSQLFIALKKMGLPFVDPPTSGVFCYPKIADFWAAVREVRLGTHPGELNNVIPVTLTLDGLIKGRQLSPRAKATDVWQTIARFPVDSEAVYIQFVYYDGSKSEEIRMPIDDVDLKE